METIYFISNDKDVLFHWQTMAMTIPYQFFFQTEIDSDGVNKKNKDLIQSDFLILHCKNEPINLNWITEMINLGKPVIIISNLPNVNDAITLFKLGIMGYLNSFASAHRIDNALASIKQGQVWIGQSILSQMLQAVPSNVENTAWQQDLSPRQINIAKQLLKGQHNAEIAKTLHLSESTLKKEIQTLFTLFSAQDRLDLVLKLNHY